MANYDTQGGFRVAVGVGGAAPIQYRFPVDSASATNMFVGDIVKAVAAGAVNPSAANDGEIVAGVVAALYDSNGVPIGSPGASVSTRYLPSSTAGYADVWLALPGVVFIGQAQTGQTPAATGIFASTNHVAGTGNTTTGRSKHELSMSDLNSGAQFLILGRVADPTNAYGEHVLLYVVFNESIFMGVGKAVGV